MGNVYSRPRYGNIPLLLEFWAQGFYRPTPITGTSNTFSVTVILNPETADDRGLTVVRPWCNHGMTVVCSRAHRGH